MTRDRKGRFAKRRKGMGMNALIYPMMGMIAWNLALGVNAHVEPTPLVIDQTVEEVPQVVLIEPQITWTPERIEKAYKEAAEKYGVSFEQMWSTVSKCENISLDPNLQSWHQDAKGPNGRENSWGLSQIHLDYHPHVTKEQATDPNFAAEFMAQKFSEGNARLWTCWRKMYGV